MNTDQLTNPIVKAAVEAINRGDRAAWFALFAPNAKMTDDGDAHDLTEWSDRDMFTAKHAQFLSIDSVSEDGRSFYGTIHVEQWGDIYGSWKFTIKDGKITRLDVAAA